VSTARCSSSDCLEPIIFAKQIGKSWTPLNPASYRVYSPKDDAGALIFVPQRAIRGVMHGNYVKVRQSGRSVAGFTSHHATCPAAAAFRRQRAATSESSDRG